MQGHCNVCGEWQEEVRACRLCGELVGQCCYSPGLQCCDHCKAEMSEEGR